MHCTVRVHVCTVQRDASSCGIRTCVHAGLIMSRESSSGSEDFSRTPHVSDSEISSDDAGELGARPYMFEPWRNKYYLFLHVRACPESNESLDSGCVAHAMAVRTKPLRLGVIQ